MSDTGSAVLSTDKWATLLRQWRDLGHRFGIIVGDLGYGGVGDPGRVLSGPIAVPDAPPILYSMGNHELDGIGKRAWIDALYPGAVAPGSWQTITGMAPGNGEHAYYSFDIGPSTHFMLLDGDHMTFDGITARAWQNIGQQQLAWIAAEIAANRTRNLMIFIHEPIDQQVNGSTPDYTLNEKGGLLDLLAGHPKNVVIFSGHFHGHRGVTKWRGVTSVHVQTETVSTYGSAPFYGVRVDVNGEAITISNAGTVADFDLHPMNSVETTSTLKMVRVAEDGSNSGQSRLASMTVTGAENGVTPTAGSLMLKTGALTWYATRFISEQLIKIQPGMKFSYDIRLAGVVGGNDAVTVQPSWYMKNGSIPPRVFDQNGFALSQRPRNSMYYMYNEDLPRLNGLASDRWYSREFDLTPLAGNYVDGLYLAASTLTNVSAVYVDNIRFTWPATSTNLAPSVAITSPTAAASFVAGSTISIAATAADTDGSVTQVAFFANGQPLGVDTSTPFVASWVNATPGTYTLTATATDNSGTTTTSSPVGITVMPTTGAQTSATYVRTDTTTAGNWKGVFGGQGYTLANDGSSLPTYATVNRTGGAAWTWVASTTDVRALQKAVGSDRIAATWYGNFDTQLAFTDGQIHRIAVYAVDFDNRLRNQTLQLIDTATSSLLDERVMTGFGNGHYVVWDIKGAVTLRLRVNSGPNAVYSAIFVDGGASPPPASTSASFVGSDSTTGGSWKGTYGAKGYALANDATSLPAYASVTHSGSSTWTWVASTTDTRALQRATSTDRMAATWYGATTDLTINLTDGLTHQVSLHMIDWDSRGRTQSVQVLDGATLAVLDTRTVSAFSGGQYLTWSLRGRVIFRVTQTGPANAVYGGVFFNQ
jgi:hypothetical protein